MHNHFLPFQIFIVVEKRRVANGALMMQRSDFLYKDEKDL